MSLQTFFIIVAFLIQFQMSIDLTYLLYHFASASSRAWKSFQNCPGKDEDLDLTEDRERINTKLAEIHKELLQHTNASDWTQEVANELFGQVQNVERELFRYQTTTDTRLKINLQNKMTLELEAYVHNK